MEKITFVCSKKCGEKVPIDIEKSNANWTVYATKCVCGADAEISLSGE